MAADSTYLDTPDDISTLAEEDLSDLDALSAVERALQGARGAEFSARVARSNADACRIESSSAEINAGTARLAASGADACADRAAIWADMSRQEADRATISAGRAEKALHELRNIGWSVALVGVGMLLGLALALLLHVMAMWVPRHAAVPAPVSHRYLTTSSDYRLSEIHEHPVWNPVTATVSWKRP